MEDELIERIKSALGLVGEFTDLQLMEKLAKARINSHPDKYQDPKIKEEKEEISKELNGLYDSFKKYLEKKRAKLFPTKIEENEITFELIQKVCEITSLQDEKRELEQRNKELLVEVTIFKQEAEKKKQNENIQNEKEIGVSIKNMYTTTSGTTVSIISFITLLLTQLKIIRSGLNDLFGDGTTVLNAIIWIVFILSLLNVLYKLALKHRINYNMKKLTNPECLQNLKLNEKFNYPNGKYYYFTELNVYNYIKLQITHFDNLLFMINKEIIHRELISYIILHLNKKGIIKRAIPQGLEMKFEVNDQ
jgi:hypothetical protein|nr:MAG TPA: hypothetical protein [Caudoviricetes sp.]